MTDLFLHTDGIFPANGADMQRADDNFDQLNFSYEQQNITTSASDLTGELKNLTNT